ncbi:Orn, Oligoribonuclease (3'-_5' exoribonuclease) [Pyrenophora tritici-repentis]|nr:Orn, Oligoribonuclease (3'->5' exoribonuclease) [Pyrenophora tritici-repentis]
MGGRRLRQPCLDRISSKQNRAKDKRRVLWALMDRIIAILRVLMRHPRNPQGRYSHSRLAADTTLQAPRQLTIRTSPRFQG